MLVFYLLISGMPLTQHPLWEHLMSDLTAIKYLGLGCLVASAFHCALTQRPPALLEGAQVRYMEALCLWAAASWLVLGAPIAWDQSPLLSYLSFLVLLVITLSLVDTWPRLEHVLWAVILADALASLYVLREWQEYHAIYADFRPGWVTGDPNYFTVSALLGLPLALAFSSRAMPWAKRQIARGCALVTMLAMGLAASRGGLLGLGAMLGFWCWRKGRLGVLLLACAAAAGPLLLWANSPLNRLLHPTVSDNESTDTRLALWQAGLHMIADHPVTGIGLGNFKGEVAEYAAGHVNLDHIAHNLYLELAAEMGVPALLGYGLMVWYSDRALAQVEVRLKEEAIAADQGLAPLPPWLRGSALGLRAGLLGFSLSAFFLSAQYTKLFWLVIALTAVIQRLIRDAGEPAPAAIAVPAHEPGLMWPELSAHG